MLHAGQFRFPFACTLRPNDSEHAVQNIWLQKQRSAEKRGGVPAGKEIPAGCHNCSLGELHSTFQCIATEREIHRNGVVTTACPQGKQCTAATKSSHQIIENLSSFRGRAETDPELEVVAEGQMETGLQFVGGRKKVNDGLRPWPKRELKCSICSPFAKELERNR